MFSRQEFFRELVARGLAAGGEIHAGEKRGRLGAAPACSSTLPATELSPALLALEAACRGVDLQDGGPDRWRRLFYAELSRQAAERAPAAPAEAPAAAGADGDAACAPLEGGGREPAAK